MKSIVIPTLKIAAVAFIAAFLLSHIKQITYPHILKQEEDKQNNAIRLVLPGYTIGDVIKTKIESDEIIYWPAEKETDGVITKAYAFISVNYGYSGDVKAMVGVDTEGRILGINIIQQTETPGLGARVTESASAETVWGRLFGGSFTSDDVTTPWFQEQFKGIDLKRKMKIVRKGDWHPGMAEELLKENEISTITGATVTTRAVVMGIQASAEKLFRAGVLTKGGGNE
jgi:electron transport complex protein RnfG